MQHTVYVSLKYRTWCPECIQDVERAVASAVRDGEVTGFSLKAVAKCDHEPELLKAIAKENAKLKANPTPPHPQNLTSGAEVAAIEPSPGQPGELCLEEIEALERMAGLPNGFDSDGQR